MSGVVALVEGATEREFVGKVLAQHLASKGVWITARVIGKPGRKGGVRSYAATKPELLQLIKEDHDRVVTTMFDYYALRTDWPGRDTASAAGRTVGQMGEHIAEALVRDVSTRLGPSFPTRRFIPHIQMHEFEALLFSEPAAIAEVCGQHHASAVGEIVGRVGSPEEIDDGPSTAPSKRLEH